MLTRKKTFAETESRFGIASAILAPNQHFIAEVGGHSLCPKKLVIYGNSQKHVEEEAQAFLKENFIGKPSSWLTSKLAELV